MVGIIYLKSNYSYLKYKVRLERPRALHAGQAIPLQKGIC